MTEVSLISSPSCQYISLKMVGALSSLLNAVIKMCIKD